MEFSSGNMHYVFNVEYFRGLRFSGDDAETEEISGRNGQIRNFRFPGQEMFPDLREDPRFRSFRLYTGYPGLLIGTGYPHDAKLKDAIKLGFSLDYVTGLPYLPGPSLKGILRSRFSEPELIRAYLGRDADTERLESEIFDGGDVFLGAWPVPAGDGRLLELEYITPHPSPFKNPVPISMMKVKPDVCFEFCFLLDDSPDLGVTAEEKLRLFRTEITETGIGAKTGVGFGRMTERPAGANRLAFDNSILKLVPETEGAAPGGPEERQKAADGSVLGPCPRCGADVKRNGETVECTGRCGMRFRKVMGAEIGDGDLAALLRGRSIELSVMDNETQTMRPARIEIGTEGGTFRPDGKNGEKKGIYRPNYVRRWLDG